MGLTAYVPGIESGQNLSLVQLCVSHWNSTKSAFDLMVIVNNNLKEGLLARLMSLPFISLLQGKIRVDLNSG